jgi:hypothetical protein
MLRTKLMEKLGFKGTGLFQTAYHTHYKKSLPENRAVIVVGALAPAMVNVFALGEKDWRAYQRGTLALVPTGCCSVSGRRYAEPNVSVEFDEMDLRQVKRIMAALEPCIRELWPVKKKVKT